MPRRTRPSRGHPEHAICWLATDRGRAARFIGRTSFISRPLWLIAAGIGVSIPISEGGALGAKIEIATAPPSQAIASYGAVVVAAFRADEKQPANERLLAPQLPLYQKSLEDRTEAVRIATIEYGVSQIWSIDNLNCPRSRFVRRSVTFRPVNGEPTHEPLPLTLVALVAAACRRLCFRARRSLIRCNRKPSIWPSVVDSSR